MSQLGPPEVVVYLMSSNICIALEGVHRLTAAEQLRLSPILRHLGSDQLNERLAQYIETALHSATVEEMVRGIRRACKMNGQYPSVSFQDYQLLPAKCSFQNVIAYRS